MQKSKMVIRIMDVTPEMAESWLEQHNTKNRGVIHAWVSSLANEISTGRWQCTHQGISFDVDGVLLDGQHRLLAIVRAGLAAEVVVFSNCPRENRDVIDVNRKRSINDCLKLSGIESNGAKTAISRNMRVGVSGKEICRSRGEEQAFYLRHQAAIDFAFDLSQELKKDRLAPAAVAGVFARAYYVEAHEAIADFVSVLRDKRNSWPQDNSALCLRDFLMNNRGVGGENHRSELFSKTEHALRAFVEGRGLRVLRITSKPIYVLPE